MTASSQETAGPVGTLSLVLHPDKPTFAAGTMPDFAVTIRNPGSRPVKLCTYMLDYRLRTAFHAVGPDGLEYELLPFKKGHWNTFAAATDVVEIAPGKEITRPLHLSKDPAWGLVRTGSRPPVVPAGMALKGCSAGAWKFRTLIQGRMALYQGAQDGNYDGRWEGKAVPDEVPGGQGFSSAALFKEKLQGETTLNFR